MPNSMKISRPVASDASANKVVDESKKNRSHENLLGVSPEMVDDVDAQKSGSFFVGGETDDKMMDFEVTEIEMIICIYDICINMYMYMHMIKAFQIVRTSPSVQDMAIQIGSEARIGDGIGTCGMWHSSWTKMI